jgi:hypothetical protein
VTSDADRDRRRRREQLLAERAALLGWRQRLLARKVRQQQARRQWLINLLER